MSFVFLLPCTTGNYNIKKKSQYRSEQAQRVPGSWGSYISRQSAHEGCKVVNPTHRPPLPPRKYSWYSFLLEAESTPRAIVWPEGLCSLIQMTTDTTFGSFPCSCLLYCKQQRDSKPMGLCECVYVKGLQKLKHCKRQQRHNSDVPQLAIY
jgi:hypothetical protein